MNLQRGFALTAGLIASTIYGINHLVAKDIISYFGPHGLVLIRILGATVLFWIADVFFKTEKLCKADYPRLLLCVFLGAFLNMQGLIVGLKYSTPINSSLIITLTPVVVMVLSAFFLKEKVSFSRVLGILLGLSGAIVLILFSLKTQINATNIPLGNFLLFINVVSFSCYIIIVKPLISKYRTTFLMKWFFLFAIFVNLPFSISEFLTVQWGTLPMDVMLKAGYVVLGTTFFAFLLNTYALRYLKATSLSVFSYVQPVVTIVIAVLLSKDSLNGVRILAMVLVFLGVYLVTNNKKKSSPITK